MKVYHIGLAKRKKTLVIQAVKCVDFLSCEIYDYFGQRETTKARLRENRYQILDLAKRKNPDVYGDLVYAVVE